MYFSPFILLYLLYTAVLIVGCNAQGLFVQTDAGADQVEVNVVSSEDGAVTGSFSASSTTDQSMAADASSAISGSQLVLPAGSLSGSTQITIEQGTSLTSGSLSDLGLGDDVEAGSNAVAIQSSAQEDPQNPMQITLPLNLSLRFALQNQSAKNISILYRVIKYSENQYIDGIFPTSAVTLVSDSVSFSAQYFGVFQVIYTDAPIQEAVSVNTDKVIETVREVETAVTPISEPTTTTASVSFTLDTYGVPSALADVDPSAPLSFVFNQGPDVSSFLEAGTATISNTFNGDLPGGNWGVQSDDNKNILFSPNDPWPLLSHFSFNVTSGIKNQDGASLSNPSVSVFDVRDGSWAVDAVEDLWVSAGGSFDSVDDFSPLMSSNEDGEMFGLTIKGTSSPKVFPIFYNGTSWVLGTAITGLSFAEGHFEQSSIALSDDGSMAFAAVRIGSDAWKFISFALTDSTISPGSLNAVTAQKVKIIKNSSGNPYAIGASGTSLDLYPYDSGTNAVEATAATNIYTSLSSNQVYSANFIDSNTLRTIFISGAHLVYFRDFDVSSSPTPGSVTAFGTIEYSDDTSSAVAVAEDGTLYAMGDCLAVKCLSVVGFYLSRRDPDTTTVTHEALNSLVLPSADGLTDGERLAIAPTSGGEACIAWVNVSSNSLNYTYAHTSDVSGSLSHTAVETSVVASTLHTFKTHIRKDACGITAHYKTASTPAYFSAGFFDTLDMESLLYKPDFNDYFADLDTNGNLRVIVNIPSNNDLMMATFEPGVATFPTTSPTILSKFSSVFGAAQSFVSYEESLTRGLVLNPKTGYIDFIWASDIGSDRHLRHLKFR